MAVRNIPQSSTKVPGDLITAAVFNTGVSYMSDFMKGPPFFRGRSGATINLTNNVWTAMPLSVTDVDSDNGHSNSVNNTRYTCQVPGWYWVEGYVALTTGGTAGRCDSAIYKNGSVMPSSQFISRSTDLCSWLAQLVVQLAAGDYVEVFCRQETGATLGTFVGTDLCPAMNLFWLHP